MATAKLKRISPGIKILTLTRHTDDAYLRELLQAGVSGYVLKQSTSDELIRAIRAIAGGNCYLDSALTGNLLREMGGKAANHGGDNADDGLTIRESETLRYVSLGYSNREIAEKFDVSVKTVEVYKAQALKKLNLSTRKDIVRYAILQGWLRED